ncbi:MAG TPA: SCO family protein [Terriglobales bacterium]
MILSIVALLALLTACKSKPAVKSYKLTGKIVSVDKNALTALIDTDEIKDFMEPMTMSYKVKDAKELNGLTPGDSISADLREQNDDYWLENIKVTAKSTGPPPAKSEFHMPSPGEVVPDFKLVNQSNKQISLSQYHGKTLILTFIYTRCPFPDFCPRVMKQFAEVYRGLSTQPATLAKVHLLSVSFDAKYDTPKVLADYGHRWAGNQAGVFDRWEFAAVSAADLPVMSKFFGLTVVPEKDDIITHSLSTAVIGPDGKIFRWYHGSDWQASDLLKDAGTAAGAGGPWPVINSRRSAAAPMLTRFYNLLPSFDRTGGLDMV